MLTDQSHPDTRVSGASICNTADWQLLSCLPKFGRRLRRDLSAAYPDLTDVLALNPATLKALRLPPETAAAIQAWQSGDSQHPVVAKVAAPIPLTSGSHRATPGSARRPHFSPFWHSWASTG